MIVVQMQKNTPFLVIGVLIIVLVAVLFTLIQGARPLEDSPVSTKNMIVSPDNDSIKNTWKDVPLRDVSTASVFNVRELKGKPVLLFCFTTWCSICTAQQNEIKRLQALSPGSFTSLGIDVDPYENEDVVRRYQSDNGFPGVYAIAPPELTNELVNEFGMDIITPASAPMILICSNGTVTQLDRGIKSAGFLEQAIRTRC
jgi:cytochrome oxidase Cu insertion factor (SCO1/SenC/PrrC family)